MRTSATKSSPSAFGPGGSPLPWLIVALVALATLSLMIGPAGFGFPRQAAATILMEIRLPRTLLAMLAGGALGLSGAALQGYLRNPLAEPGVIGISGGAGLGAVLAIHTGAASLFALALPLGGLLGAAAAMAAVLGLAGARGGGLTLILAGVAVASLATALTSGVLSLSRNPFASVEMVFWLLGSLADRSLEHVLLAGPFLVTGCLLLLTLGRPLDALTLGEDVAQNLGADLGRLRLVVVAGATLAVGAATAVAGTIGFVGLVVPHLIRPLVGSVPSRLLPASLAGGAVLLLAADIAIRVLAPGGEIRLGVVTALIGAPFFLWLVAKTRKELAP